MWDSTLLYMSYVTYTVTAEILAPYCMYNQGFRCYNVIICLHDMECTQHLHVTIIFVIGVVMHGWHAYIFQMTYIYWIHPVVWGGACFIVYLLVWYWLSLIIALYFIYVNLLFRFVLFQLSIWFAWYSLRCSVLIDSDNQPMNFRFVSSLDYYLRWKIHHPDLLTYIEHNIVLSLFCSST